MPAAFARAVGLPGVGDYRGSALGSAGTSDAAYSVPVGHPLRHTAHPVVTAAAAAATVTRGQAGSARPPTSRAAVEATLRSGPPVSCLAALCCRAVRVRLITSVLRTPTALMII